MVRNYKARMGRNPQTGEAIKIPARRRLKFVVAKAAKDAGPRRQVVARPRRARGASGAPRAFLSRDLRAAPLAAAVRELGLEAGEPAPPKSCASTTISILPVGHAAHAAGMARAQRDHQALAVDRPAGR